MAYQTEYPFTLPRGYMDENGILHREGMMRFATAADEILPLKDPRVQQNPAYLSVVLMTRVITKLGSLPAIDNILDQISVTSKNKKGKSCIVFSSREEELSCCDRIMYLSGGKLMQRL